MTTNKKPFAFNIFCRDNTPGINIFSGGNDLDNPEQVVDSLKKIADKNLDKLTEDNPELLVFPANFKVNKDEIGKSCIIGLTRDNEINTNNLMGFVGVDEVGLTIGSRFDRNKKKQYFLQYLLQKVFAINLVSLQTTAGEENIWDFLLFFIFPYYLNKAVRQGVFKQYVRRQYNDSNVKGAIDVPRHIRQNIPFMGKVAYNTREYSYDNPITQLIRHTIEFIGATKFRNALSQNPETIENVKLLQQLTPSYSLRERQNIIAQNLNPVRHPYFTEYEYLRKICLQILRYQGMAFRKNSERVYGVLFDGAWLWEEYLNVVFKENNLGFVHPENKTGKNKVYLFNEEKYDNKIGNKIMFPDFYKEKENEIVVDAKYKHLEEENSEVTTGDYYQVITYMYRLKAHTGVLLYPVANENNSLVNSPVKFYMHKDSYGGNGAAFIKYGLAIPQNEDSFEQFTDKISKEEQELSLQDFLQPKTLP